MFIRVLIISSISMLSSIALANAPCRLSDFEVSYHIKNDSAREVVVKNSWGNKDAIIHVGKDATFSHCIPRGRGSLGEHQSSVTFFQAGHTVCGYTTYLSISYDRDFTSDRIDPKSIKQSGSITGGNCHLDKGKLHHEHTQLILDGRLW